MRRIIMIGVLFLMITVPGVIIVGSVFSFYYDLFKPSQEVQRQTIRECIDTLIELDKSNHNTKQESTQ